MMRENILMIIAHFRDASGGGGGTAPLCIITESERCWDTD
jgi:hypothetical protein